MVKSGKNSTRKNNFYSPILEALKSSTNLTEIQKKYSISKQNLNYYLRQLTKKGLLINKGPGIYEVVKNGKNLTQYGNLLPKDFIRSHAYIINVVVPKISNWEKRKEILEKKNIHYVLVGAMKNIPRIKVMGRKIWLCNDHIRIFDKKNESYYGKTGIEGRKQAIQIFYKIITILENKFGVMFRPLNFSWKKEHYSLIKNDLAIDQNQKGIIWRISDESGEWLLIDDSLEEGGELETIGKSSLRTNIKLSKWWNEQKETNFQVTPTFILNSFDKMIKNSNLYNENIVTHVAAIKQLGDKVGELTKLIEKLNEIVDRKI